MNRRSQAIIHLESAIARTQQTLDDMADALGPDQCPCCVGAAYGGTHGTYDPLKRKLERQRAWLEVCLARRSGDKRALAISSEEYGRLTSKRKSEPQTPQRNPFFLFVK